MKCPVCGATLHRHSTQFWEEDFIKEEMNTTDKMERYSCEYNGSHIPYYLSGPWFAYNRKTDTLYHWRQDEDPDSEVQWHLCKKPVVRKCDPSKIIGGTFR